jgi:hypothetical protein
LLTWKGFSFNNDNSTRQILRNNDKVSRWCLTYNDEKNIFGNELRGTIYGKMISQITRGSVTDDFISTSMHYIAKPDDKRL